MLTSMIYVSEELFVSLPSLLFVVPLHAPAQTGPNEISPYSTYIGTLGLGGNMLSPHCS